MGAAFGFAHGWIATQLALVWVLWALQGATADCGRAAGLAGAFSFSVIAAGSLGFVTGAPEGFRVWALIPWLAFSLAFAAGGAAAAFVSASIGGSDRLRWGIVWPAGWMATEWAVSQGPAGIPWLRLGQQQAPDGPLAGALPLGGSLLAGLAMWWLAAMVLSLLLAPSSRRWLALGTAALLVGAAVAQQVSWTEPASPLRARLLQPGNKATAEHRAHAAVELLEYYRRAALSAEAEVVFTPQLALPKTADAVPARYWATLDDALARRRADLVMGVYLPGADEHLYNAALTLGASGSQRYLKQHVFPFGESLPVGGTLRRWIDGAMPRPIRDTLRGSAADGPLRLAGRPVALSICYEAAFGDAWREQAGPAELLVSLSSDSAIDSAQVLRQSLQHLQARALEFGKPVLRTSDVAGTAAFDHRGRQTAVLPARQRGELDVAVALRTGLTPYARFGDALAACVAALILAAGCLPRRPMPAAAARRLRHEAGQVMLPAVALLAISSGLLYFMVNSNQAINEKTRVTNAADAAAYSAGIVEARALNFHAYTNRAMVANEIVIAQLVSFGSWIRYFGNAVDNIGANVSDQVFMLQPNVQGLQLTGTFAVAAYGLAYAGMTGNELADYVVQSPYGIGIGITVQDAVVQLLTASQSLVSANLAAGVRQQQIADDVVQAMDPALSAEVVQVTHGFDGFTKRYERSGSTDDRGRFADVTMRSRDPFTRERNWTIDSNDIPLVRKNGAMKKRGGTDLVGYDEWRAVDTLELHGQRFGCGRFGLSWCDDIQTPIGWGAVNVNAGSGDQGPGYHGNAYGENGRTAGQADAAMEEPAYYVFSGLPGSQDLDNLDPSADITSGITIMVTKRHADMLVSGGAAQARPSGALALFGDRPSGGMMRSVSRAQVFFDRIAPRADGRVELGSLYNPYWRVRLVAPLEADRVYAATGQGVVNLR